MKTTFTVLLTVAVALLAHGRSSRTWSFQELTDQADLVVIAKPISTTNTTEHSLPRRVTALRTEASDEWETGQTCHNMENPAQPSV